MLLRHVFQTFVKALTQQQAPPCTESTTWNSSSPEQLLKWKYLIVAKIKFGILMRL
jgi:hypothetical protein